MRLCEFDLVCDGSAVDLYFHQMSLLLFETGLADLGVCQHTDDGAVLADALEFAGNVGTARLSMLLGVLGEGFLL